MRGELREAVGLALKQVRSWDGSLIVADAQLTDDEVLGLADAALAAMFEALKEPSEGMLEAANVADRGMLPWEGQWQAMLSAFTREHAIQTPD